MRVAYYNHFIQETDKGDACDLMFREDIMSKGYDLWVFDDFEYMISRNPLFDAYLIRPEPSCEASALKFRKDHSGIVCLLGMGSEWDIFPEKGVYCARNEVPQILEWLEQIGSNR